MESFSKTLDSYTGSYVARRRRRRIIWGGVALLAAAAAVLIILLAGKGKTAKNGGHLVSKQQVVSEWSAKKWDAVLADCSSSLTVSPLDSFYLGFEGLSSYYKGMELPEGEDRAALMDQCVSSLRKALVDGTKGGRLPRSQLEYVLGKAYYNKGREYWDLCVKFLEASIKDGYVAEDSREYLGVAYAGLGDNKKAIENFNAALSRGKSDLLLIATAQAYKSDSQPEQAESLLLQALASSTDVIAREKCRFILADIYSSRQETGKAKEQLDMIVQENPDSAEGHYQLGLIYQKEGDPIHARAEWRRAVSIDPMHAAARQKLAEKL